MTRITNSDQIMLLLRQQLQRTTGRKDASRTNRSTRGRETPKNAAARIRAIGQLSDFSSEDFERALIQSLLAEELGEGLLNDPRFQKIVDNVLSMLASDAATRRLIGDAREALLR